MGTRYYVLLAIIGQCLSNSGVAGELAQDTIVLDSGTGMRADGSWGLTRPDAGQSVQRWGVEALRFKDGQLRGRIEISGSKLCDAANIEGEMSGRGVAGTLVDDEGKELATFEGALTRNGAFGTYRDRTGEVGNWVWEGELKP